MSSNQFQNARAFFYAAVMSDSPLRSYIINSMKFPACLFALNYPNEDSFITSWLCHKMLIVSWPLEIMAQPVKGANRGDELEVFWRKLLKNNMTLPPSPPLSQTTSSGWGNFSKMGIELFQISAGDVINVEYFASSCHIVEITGKMYDRLEPFREM
ncbi:hypothetical protein BDQ17DRAFT_1334125 [Cyathus striatus]|nr:hypothetical protein BDQ17DRAFT_1334125 [Cyathus striatus]